MAALDLMVRLLGIHCLIACACAHPLLPVDLESARFGAAAVSWTYEELGLPKNPPEVVFDPLDSIALDMALHPHNKNFHRKSKFPLGMLSDYDERIETELLPELQTLRGSLYEVEQKEYGVLWVTEGDEPAGLVTMGMGPYAALTFSTTSHLHHDGLVGPANRCHTIIMHTTTDVGTGIALAHIDDGEISLDTGAVATGKNGQFTFGQGTGKMMAYHLLQMYLDAGTARTRSTWRFASYADGAVHVPVEVFPG